jgi:hypothetical protein
MMSNDLVNKSPPTTFLPKKDLPPYKKTAFFHSKTYTLINFTTKYGVIAVISGYVGYHSLGYAYEYELMATIDRIAMNIILKKIGMGYGALGLLMPRVQWYSACFIQSTVALMVSIILIETQKIILYAYHFFMRDNSNKPVVAQRAS